MHFSCPVTVGLRRQSLFKWHVTNVTKIKLWTTLTWMNENFHRCPKSACLHLRAELPTWALSSSSCCSSNDPTFSPSTLLQVDIIIPKHPELGSSDKLYCVFGNFTTEAFFDGKTLVTCSLPDPIEIPSTPDQQGNTHPLKHTYMWINVDSSIFMYTPS